MMAFMVECNNCETGEQCGAIMHGNAVTFCEPYGPRELVQSWEASHTLPYGVRNPTRESLKMRTLFLILLKLITTGLNTTTASVLQFSIDSRSLEWQEKGKNTNILEVREWGIGMKGSKSQFPSLSFGTEKPQDASRLGCHKALSDTIFQANDKKVFFTIPFVFVLSAQIGGYHTDLALAIKDLRFKRGKKEVPVVGGTCSLLSRHCIRGALRQSQATVVNLGKGKSYSVDRSLCDSGAAIQKGLCEEEIHPVYVEQLAPSNVSTIIHILYLPEDAKGENVQFQWKQENLRVGEVYEACWALDNVLVINSAHRQVVLEDNLDPIDTGNWLFFPGATVKV
eukprot:bmy_17046T0